MKCQVCSTPKTLVQHLAFSRVVTLEIAACARFQLVQISGSQICVGFFTPQYRVTNSKPSNDYPRSDNPKVKDPTDGIPAGLEYPHPGSLNKVTSRFLAVPETLVGASPAHKGLSSELMLFHLPHLLPQVNWGQGRSYLFMS